MSLSALITKATLSNAVQHKGSANPNAVLSRVLSAPEGRKADRKKLVAQIKTKVDEINKLSLAEQTKRLQKIDSAFFAPKEKKTLPKLPGAKIGKVVLRFAPSPSGPMHIGHTFGTLLNYLYKKEYNGKLILRIEDTNPANIYPGAYDGLKEDGRWLTDNGIDQVVIQSDRLRIYYKYGTKLVKEGKAYVCTCAPEVFRKRASAKKACTCRGLPAKIQINRWKDMFDAFQPGQAVLRIKTNLNHKNPAIRDWPAFRISTDEHPRLGKIERVWPLMNFSVAVDDHELGLTHIIRGKEHADNTLKQEYIFKYFKWKVPRYFHHGRLNFKGISLSATELRSAVTAGRYTGWDDVRAPTLQAFRRRGIQPGAFQRYVKEMGISKVDKTVKYEEYMKTIYKFNRTIIDEGSKRFFFVSDPVKIKFKSEKSFINLKVHPDFPETRLVSVTPTLYISKKDKGSKLKGLEPGGKIQWVSTKNVPVEILMPDGKVTKGVAEEGIKKLRIGDIIQFERFGFCRLDQIKGKTYVFAFGHN